MSFRSAFEYAGNINWFPGHMLKATKDIEKQLRAVDYVIEVRDSRIPITSGNNFLEQYLKRKNRIIIFNKADLANTNLQQRITRLFEKQNTPVLFTSANSGTNVQKVIRTCLERFPVTKQFRIIPYMFLVAGIPNVGKSSLIGALRQKNKVSGASPQVGPLPGVTRRMSGFQVLEKPNCVVLDTPGIMMPAVNDNITGLKLALTGAIKDSVVGEEVIADFLLFQLNRHSGLVKPPTSDQLNTESSINDGTENRFVNSPLAVATQKRPLYVTEYNLEQPTDDITVLLHGIAKRIGALHADGQPDLLTAASHFLRAYRSGQLGRFTLDDIPE